uniref:Serpin domain-containing protein n=1 Tax=Anopheles atroparvus TaxID=41427 RepID=A0A182IXS8_ANOAO
MERWLEIPATSDSSAVACLSFVHYSETFVHQIAPKTLRALQRTLSEMRLGYVASWMMVVVVVMLATMQTVSAASGQANGMQNVVLAKQNPLDRLQANPASVNQVSDSVTNLAQKIARSTASPKSKTEIFSPVSIAGALSLLMLGSSGQTQRELLNMMGFGEGTSTLSFQELHYAFGRLFQDLVANDPSLVPLVAWRVNDKCNRYDEDYPPAKATASTIAGALSLLMLGSSGQTQRELLNMMGFGEGTSTLSFQELHYAFGRLFQDLVANDPSLVPLVAWRVNDKCNRYDEDYPPAKATASTAAAQINGWCARETDGKIRETVTAQMVANPHMIVASALYFKAQWETTFSPYGTRRRPFYLNGRQEPPIFNATAYGAQIIGLPYETGISTMYIVLPNNSTRLELQRLQTILGAAQLNWMIDQMKTKKGMVVLPKLSISNRIQLSSVLQQLGVRDLFDPSRSNLSPVLDLHLQQTMLQNQNFTPLFVYDIVTQAKLDVNEQGTEGGAFTTAPIDPIGPGYTFQVNSPFLILIRHDITKALLFYGALYDPRP